MFRITKVMLLSFIILTALAMVFMVSDYAISAAQGLVEEYAQKCAEDPCLCCIDCCYDPIIYKPEPWINPKFEPLGTIGPYCMDEKGRQGVLVSDEHGIHCEIAQQFSPDLPWKSNITTSSIQPSQTQSGELNNWNINSTSSTWISSNSQTSSQVVRIDDWTYKPTTTSLLYQPSSYNTWNNQSNYLRDNHTISWTINPIQFPNLSQSTLQNNISFLSPRTMSYPTNTPWALSTQSDYNLQPEDSFVPTYPSNITTLLYGPSYDDGFLDPLEILLGKPAIYLYPEEDTSVNVILTFNGVLTDSDPVYPPEGWNVFAMADGTLIIDSLEYNYLFWEGNLEYDLLSLPDEGWVIAQEKLAAWFDKNLNALGLIDCEKEEFIEYWVARLQGYPFYEIKLVDQQVLNNHATLTITDSASSSPDTMIRLIFHFRGLNEYQYIEAPKIVTPERVGFVVVEWGGIFD